MSYDLQLYRQDDKKEPLSRNDLQKLDEKFVVNKVRTDEHGRVLDFAVKYKDNQPNWLEEDGWEISWQEVEHLEGEEETGGYYWHYISYSATDEMFQYFKNIAEDVADVLHLKIVDPQLGIQGLEEDKIETGPARANALFNIAQNVTKNLSEKFFLYEPAESTYFIKLFIRAWDPKSSDPTMLTLLQDGNQMYCSKVETGQTLDEVLKKEIPTLIGDDYYQVMTMLDGDFAFDKHGNKLPRKNVFIDIPYFDPKTRDLKYDMRWA
jgi:hypothetical protein